MSEKHNYAKKISISYILLWIISVALFWFEPFRNALGFLGYFICLHTIFGVVIPFIFCLSCSVKKRIHIFTFVQPILYGIGSMLNHFLTITLYLWKLGQFNFDARLIILPIISGFIGALIGLVANLFRK